MKLLSVFPSLTPMLIALLAGAAVPFQAASNAALGRALGHPLWSTLASLIVSILVVLPLLLLMRTPLPSIGTALQGPVWLWFGGLAGVAYVTAALILAPKIGIASFMVSVIAGQMLASVFIDHMGLMGLAIRPAGWGKILGVALIILGMFIVQMNNTMALNTVRSY